MMEDYFYRAVEVFSAACIKGDTETANRFIDKYKDALETCDIYGLTALMFMSSWGNVPAVRTLLLHGAAVNAKTPHGLTALHYAAKNGQVETFTQLLAAGADIDAKSNIGQTAAGYAQNVPAASSAYEGAQRIVRMIEQEKLSRNVETLRKSAKPVKIRFS